MSENLVYYSMVVLILVAALAILAANVRYIIASFSYSFEEGVASLSFAIAGYIIFLLSKLLVVPLSDIVASLFVDRMLAALVPSALAGWLVGLFYVWQMKRRTFRSFRWSLMLISVLHGLLIDFVLILMNSSDSPPQTVMVASSVFVVCALITWAANVRGELKGNVLDPLAEESQSSHFPRDAQSHETTKDGEHPKFPF